MISPESHKTRSSDYVNPEGDAAPKGCEVCGGALKREATKYCSSACYRVVQRSLSPEARFWAKVDRTAEGDGCWLWKASRSGGRGGAKYGQFTYTVDGKQVHVSAHVYAYELAHGPVPAGMEVMHKCHTRLCCRGSHLEAGTHVQNVKDSAEQGHYHTPRPKRQTVTDEQLGEMLSLHRAGMLQKDIAARFGVSPTFICMLVKGKRRQYSDPVKATKQGAA